MRGREGMKERMKERDRGNERERMKERESLSPDQSSSHILKCGSIGRLSHLSIPPVRDSSSVHLFICSSLHLFICSSLHLPRG